MLLTETEFQTKNRLIQITPDAVRIMLRCADLLVVVFAGIVIFLAKMDPTPDLFGPMSTRYYMAILCGAFLTGVQFHCFAVYDNSNSTNLIPPIGRTLLAWMAVFGILLSAAFLLKISSSYSRVWASFWFISVAIGLTAVRMGATHWFRHLYKNGVSIHRMVIFGGDGQGQRIARHLAEHTASGIQVLGFIDDRRSCRTKNMSDLHVIGNSNTLIELIRGDFVDEVIIALPPSAHERIQELLRKLTITPVQVSIAPDFPSLASKSCRFNNWAGLPMWEIYRRPMTGWDSIAKKAEDYLLASIALLFVLPLLALIALAIKLDSPGPVYFRQERYGFNNQTFRIWKFRTLRVDAADHTARNLVTRNDPRVTRVGRFLRKMSLDELPQLFNVLCNEMSLIGPRPHALHATSEGYLYEDVVHRYAARHKVKPGITGWAQVKGWRGETDKISKIKHRVEHDMYYIENWTLLFDIRILVMTFVVLFDKDNVY